MVSPSQKVFGIEHLVAKILKGTETIQCFKFRIINKTFDNVIRQRVRQDYQELIIGFKDVAGYTKHGKKIVVSDRKEWTNQSIWTLFKILKKTDKPILKAVKLRNIPDLRVNRKRLHSEIVKLAKRSGTKKYFEMNQLCPKGCKGCLQVALGCREYGPMQLKVFKEAFVENKKHFEVLIISESLLCEIAKNCVQSSETREQCLLELDRMITSNISCDVLVLQLQDKPYAFGFLENYVRYGLSNKFLMNIPPSEALPLEIIDQMITGWKVKSLKFKFLYTNRKPVFSKVWSEQELFTKIYLDQDIRKVRPLEHHLEKVEIDLSDSLMSPFPINDEGMAYLNRGIHEEHLIGNIRKLFPTKKYSIVANQNFGFDFYNFEERLTSLLNTVWTDGSKNIELSFRHIAFHTSIDVIENFRVPSVFRSRPLRHLNAAVPIKLVIKYWSDELHSGNLYTVHGRRFELEDESTKCTFKADIFIETSIDLDLYGEIYSRDVPIGHEDPNSLWPIVYDIGDNRKEVVMDYSRKFGPAVFQGPLPRDARCANLKC